MSAPLLLARRRAHAHRRVPHPARRRLRGAGGRGDDAARPQRRRQDDDAAHDHGPVARRRRARSRFDGATTIAGGAQRRRDIARARHRLRAREHGHLRRPDGAREHAARGARARARVDELDAARLDWMFGLFPALKKFWLHPAGKLSGGQKQMLAIARAMVEPRRLLLIDEPTKGLAPAIVQQPDRGAARAEAHARPRSCSSSRTSRSPRRSATASR